MKLVVVGATGLVGNEIIKVLEERSFPATEVIPVASPMSCGKQIIYEGSPVDVVSIEAAILAKPELAIFSAGAQISLQYAPEFTRIGTKVIDNSSAWRMNKGVPLIVPEVNGSVLTREDNIISNPNCSTIQLVVVLAPLYRKYGLKRIVVSTYQSVTGSGMKGIIQLRDERKGILGEKTYPYPIDMNVIPHGGDFCNNAYTTEEMKLINETIKIFNDSCIRITATVVRVPVTGGHSESVNVEFLKDFEMSDIREIISNSPGLVLLDDTAADIYPMPLFVRGKDDVFAGRLRRDESQANTLNLWIVADNLRKGAATNAVQIAEYLLEKGLL